MLTCFRRITLLLLISAVNASAVNTSLMQTNDVAHYFETIKSNPELLIKFLTAMPKGGDLHNHVSGATYAENLIHYAHDDSICIQPDTLAAFISDHCLTENQLNNAIKNPLYYNKILNDWSMRHFQFDNQRAGHDHFFATFGKFGVITEKHTGEILAEILTRAASQNESYLELMLTPDGNASGHLGEHLGWDPDFHSMRQKLLSAHFSDIIKRISHSLDQTETKMRSILACDTAQPQSGCHLKVRYLYQVLREHAPQRVFAQLLAGFEAASKDKRIVGINMVQAEDGKIAMRDYHLHMQMIAFLRKYYPQVPVSLHAGELNSILVPKEGLSFHINEAVKVAEANRIGHGVDIAHENNAASLLSTMASKHILVEINLTSNREILNIEGRMHPLPLYLQYGVPISLSTDDEGVSRGNLTHEYLHAVQTFQLNYATLKTFARNSLTYAFLPGQTLWSDNDYLHVNHACADDRPGSSHPSSACKTFLARNEKARLQWDLEKRFSIFENLSCTKTPASA